MPNSNRKRSATKSVMKKMLWFTIPIWASMMVNSLLGITDFLFLSSISNHYMSVVGLAYVPFNFLISLLVGVGIEANRTKAKGEKIHFLHIFIWTCVISSLITLTASIFSKYFLFFTWGSQYYQEVNTYFGILTIAIIPTSILFICTGLLRGSGQPHITLYFSGICVVFNLIFDFLFITYQIFGDPLIGCAAATVVADTLTVLSYFYYLRKKGIFYSGEKMDVSKFFKNAFTNSLEKIFSVSTLQLVSSFFLVKIDIIYSAIYFALERFMQPVHLYAHSHFEWIIYSRSKKIRTPVFIYLAYFILCLSLSVFFIYYLNMNSTAMIYTAIYLSYIILFFIQRTIVAEFFVHEKGKIVNYIILMKNLLFIATLIILVKYDKLSLITFGVANLSYLIIENIVLIIIKTKNTVE
ncbi:polysaccharide biosynthesis C-terminal domain-containing protein [Bacillus xiamenensis]|uniref:Polysaccharide biosynthesis C-terminal domain-containing protein n=1 Tax=Bacillus xiamenensis TaxID=1178537 RepID=A0ABT4F3W1_9BACI|nr:polysaccharide biosynthesis C-terminal domain-containing protein [Bacillus xiamenensis]MCY9576747.1 polysaccharide biosynthesis C-terminal domain-containing protein [Bacillus xiamenensis]